MPSENMRKAKAKVFKALGHPVRMLIVEALCEKKHCVQELVALSGFGFPSISKHLSLLKEAGIIVAERRGQQIFYSVRLPCVGKAMECARSIVSLNFEAELKGLKADLDIATYGDSKNL